MAPKAKAAGKRAAKAKAAPKASGAGADLQAGVTRWLGRRDTDEAAERSMQEHFPTSSRAQRTQKLVHGVSMKHHIMAAKRKARAEGKRLGSLFWSGVRELYLSDLQQTFHVKDAAEPVNKTFASALHMCRTANAAARNRKGLIAYMATCRSLNQKEMVGLCRLLVTQNYNRNAVIKGFDKTWSTKVDAFTQLHGPAGKATLQQAILQVLPADGDYKSLDDVLGGLAALRGQQLFKFGCKDSKDMLDSVVDVYKSVKAGSFSAADCKESTLMQQVCAAIPWSYQFKDKHQGKGRVTHGPAGLELEVKHLARVHAAGKLTMEQLSNVNIFGHWVPEKVRKEVEAMTTAILGGFKSASKRKAAASASSGSKGAASQGAASSKRKAAVSEQSEFDGIFAELFG